VLVICPYCGIDSDKVIDSRSSNGGLCIRRRRQCLQCDKRFTTYERVERTARLMVVKRDGTRVQFNPDNIMQGIAAACGKRAVPEDIKQQIVADIDDDLHRDFEREVESAEIGRRVAEKLREIDPIAYLRFASEYYAFKSLQELEEEITYLRTRVPNLPNQGQLFAEDAS
jgi:transcriptional repressor NrdR